MNFINPYIEFYFSTNTLKTNNNIPFYKEVSWTFLKNINNRLKLFRHRLNIEIVDEEPSQNIMKFGSIFIYRIKLNKSFNEIIDIEKRKALLDIIYNAFIKIGTDDHWDLSVIEDAYLKSLTQIDTFEYLTDVKLRKDKQYKGQLKLTLENNTLTFNVELSHQAENSNKMYKLLETSEDNFSWNRMFKEFGWLDNNRFGLKFLNGDLWVVINIANGQVEEFKRPKKFDLKKIEDYLVELKKPAYNSTFA